jgi:hypothetical protein
MAGKNFSGKAYEKALAEIKVKIQEENMGDSTVIGTCKNCERPGLKIDASERGFCGTCRGIVSRIRDPEARKAALAAAAERLQKKGVQKHKPRAKKGGGGSFGKLPAVNSTKLRVSLPARRREPLEESDFTIQLFTERDKIIFNEVARIAEEEFRTISHQALYFIKKGMEAS